MYPFSWLKSYVSCSERTTPAASPKKDYYHCLLYCIWLRMAAIYYDTIVLGAGASGLVCGSTAAARGKTVLIIDQGAKPAQKLAVTGGGKCNLTNKTMRVEDFAGENPAFCRSALARFTPRHLLDWIESEKVAVEEREEGQIFCQRSAKDMINLLTGQCNTHGCRMALGEKILSVEPSEGGSRFLVRTSANVYAAQSVVIATGGPAWPQVGGTGTGYELARAFGHRIVSIRPALTGLTLPDDWVLAGLAGISLPATIRLKKKDSLAAGEKPAKKHQQGMPVDGVVANNLPLLFTHKGISGPAALQASLYWRKGDSLIIDFLPSLPLADLLTAPDAGKTLTRNLLRRHLPARLSDMLTTPEVAEKKTAEISRQQREQLFSLIHNHEVIPTGTEGFAKAEVTAGGVSTEDISSRSMESKRVPGLFFCGEVLDITGRLGGYNLHWAFASGHAAGENV